MAGESRKLGRLEVLQGLRISNLEAVLSTVHVTLTSGALQTGFALWLGASSLWMGVLGAIPTLAALVQMASSYAVERRGERRLFTAWFTLACRVLWLPILLVPFFMPTHLRFGAFVALFTVACVLGNIPAPAFNSWLSDLVPPDHRGRYFGRRNMLAGLTAMFVSLPAGWFLDLSVKRHLLPQAVAFASLFGLSLIFAVAGFICLLRQPEPPMKRSPEQSQPGFRGVVGFYRAPFVDPVFRRFMAFSAMSAFAQFFAAPFYTVYALNVLKLDYAWLQILGALASLAALLTMPLWGYLDDKYGSKPLMMISVFGTALLPLGWVFVRAGHMQLGLPILALNHLAGGLFWGGVGLTQFNMLIAGTPSERRSVYLGAISAVTGLAGGLAPVVGGVLMEWLRPVDVIVIGWHLSNYHLVFILNSLLRFACLPSLRGLGAGGASSTRTVLSSLGGVKMGTIGQMRRLQRSGRELDRRQAAQALATSRSTLAVEELIAALGDPSVRVRQDAAEALGEIADARAVEALVTHMLDAAGGIVRECAQALGAIGDAGALPALGTLLASGEPPEQAAAARALGRIGGPEAAAFLAARLGSQDGRLTEDVREACALALGEVRAPEGASALVALAVDGSRSVRIAAVRSIGEARLRDGVDALCASLQDLDPTLRSHAAVALAAIGATDRLGAVLDALEGVDAAVVRKQIVHAVGEMAGVGEAVYMVVSQDGMARDERVERLLGAAMGTSGTAGAMDSYSRGDFGGALTALLGAATAPGSHGPREVILNWARRTAANRSVMSEEFLLALCAAAAD